MKQTAVEWLMEEYINGLSINLQIMKKALEMEKEQIIDAFNGEPHCDGDGDRYYNENFKSE